MLTLSLIFAFLCAFSFILGFLMPSGLIDNRPTLQLKTFDTTTPSAHPEQKKKKGSFFYQLLKRVSIINAPLGSVFLRKRITRDLSMGHIDITVDEFLLIKELGVILLLVLMYPIFGNNADFIPFWILMSLAGGYMLPEFWLKGRIRGIKDAILRDLPDTVDLLGLCVNAGLDFMMALKYLIDKSAQTVVIRELSHMLQEINVGKPRREALRDMARKYDLPDLSTFSRTLIQADRMGTSVSDALNILSEDMREARYRRGEALALKAPLKMLLPLLFFIFPVVAILVAGPIFIDFFQNNPIQHLGG